MLPNQSQIIYIPRKGALFFENSVRKVSTTAQLVQSHVPRVRHLHQGCLAQGVKPQRDLARRQTKRASGTLRVDVYKGDPLSCKEQEIKPVGHLPERG